MSDNAFRYDDAATQYSPIEPDTNVADSIL
jgi:hypothetical protein